MNPIEADVFGELWSSLVLLLTKVWPNYTITSVENVGAVELLIKLTKPRGKEAQ